MKTCHHVRFHTRISGVVRWPASRSGARTVLAFCLRLDGNEPHVL
jgi:hypothetical protein